MRAIWVVVFLTTINGKRHCMHDSVWTMGSSCKIPSVAQSYTPSEPQPIRINIQVIHGAGCTTPELDLVTEDAIIELELAARDAIRIIQNVVRVQSISKSLSINFESKQLFCIHKCASSAVDWIQKSKKTWENTDLVILFTLHPTEDGSSAWGFPTILDQNGRPVVGVVNFGPRELTSRDITRRDRTEIILHELIHILGFSQPMYKLYSAIPTHGSSATYSAVHRHFGCTTNQSIVNLFVNEDLVSSHWNKGLLVNEIMTPTWDSGSVVFSEMTMALLQDTGWYSVYPYEAGTSAALPWGINGGCSFLDAGCNALPSSYTCSAKNPRNDCAYNKMWTSACDKTYRNCSIMVPSTSCARDTSRVHERYGEKFSGSSRCFMSSLYRGFGDPKYGGRCYDHRCNSDGTLGVLLAGDWYNCTAESDVVTIANYMGEFRCPSPDEYCTTTGTNECQNCGPHGICLNGLCQCKYGWIGASCEQSLCPFDFGRECGRRGECLRTTGVCKCRGNWIGEACQYQDSPLANGEEIFNPGGSYTLDLRSGWFYLNVSIKQGEWAECILNVSLEAGGDTDVQLYSNLDKLPDFADYDDFDQESWWLSRNQHSLSSFGASGTAYFAVFTSSDEPIAATVNFNFGDDLDGKYCNNVLNDCNGNGICHRDPSSPKVFCSCHEDFSGSTCAIHIKRINTTGCLSVEFTGKEVTKYYRLDIVENEEFNIQLKSTLDHFRLVAFDNLPLAPGRSIVDFTSMALGQRVQNLHVYDNWLLEIQLQNSQSNNVELCVTPAPVVDNCEMECLKPWYGACCSGLLGLMMARQLVYHANFHDGRDYVTSFDMDEGSTRMFIVNAGFATAIQLITSMGKGMEAFVGVSQNKPKTLHDLDFIVPNPNEKTQIPYLKYYVVHVSSYNTSATFVASRASHNGSSTISVEEPDAIQNGGHFIILSICAGLGSAFIGLSVAIAWRYSRQRRKTTGLSQKKMDTLGSEWRLAVDPETGSVFYYNETTRETRWDPPEQETTSIA